MLRKSKVCALLLFTSMLLLSFSNLTFAETPNNTYSKVYCSATLEESFTDNEIIIVVFPEFNNTEYNISDFSSINCVAIRELSQNVEEGTLGRILKLTISDHSKQKVLDAI